MSVDQRSRRRRSPAERLYRAAYLVGLAFETTADLTALPGLTEHQRAREAIAFGTGKGRPGASFGERIVKSVGLAFIVQPREIRGTENVVRRMGEHARAREPDPDTRLRVRPAKRTWPGPKQV